MKHFTVCNKYFDGRKPVQSLEEPVWEKKICYLDGFQCCIANDLINAKENELLCVRLLQLFLAPQPLQRWSVPLMTASPFLGTPQATKVALVSWAIFWKSARKAATCGPLWMPWMNSSKVGLLFSVWFHFKALLHDSNCSSELSSREDICSKRRCGGNGIWI